ncbi:hypothetical protein Hanom_Chr12g01169281 [Helianthus anomalus]
MANFSSGSCIFVPLSSVYSSAVVSGVLLSPQEVYWHDNIINADCEQRKMLSNLYRCVSGCGVKENPPLVDYLSFLHHLSIVSTPLKAAKKVSFFTLLIDIEVGKWEGWVMGLDFGGIELTKNYFFQIFGILYGRFL